MKRERIVGLVRCGTDAPLQPHNPQWSFVQNKSCVRWERLVHRYPQVTKCKTQCIECRAICEQNDYVRGFEYTGEPYPNDRKQAAPHYPVPSVIGEISFHPEFVTLWSVDMEQPKQTWWKRYAWE